MVKKILNRLIQPLAEKLILSRNRRFHNLHKGEECYLFGNGVSLKYFDICKFIDKPSLSCGWLHIHKDYDKLNIVSDIELHPFINFPFLKNTHNKKYQYNSVGSLQEKTGKYINKNVFVSLTNYPMLFLKKNIYYLHNFNKSDHQFKFDISNSFNLNQGAVYGLIGLALYMGFKKIYLVGMDYYVNEPEVKHFYDYGKGNLVKMNTPEMTKTFFSDVNKLVDISIIVRNDKTSELCKTVKYEDMFFTKDSYQEIDKILDKDKFELLKSCKHPAWQMGWVSPPN